MTSNNAFRKTVYFFQNCYFAKWVVIYLDFTLESKNDPLVATASLIGLSTIYKWIVISVKRLAITHFNWNNAIRKIVITSFLIIQHLFLNFSSHFVLFRFAK